MIVPDSIGFFPLKHKSNFFDTFVNFQRYIETQSSSKIKAFQCDGGIEFTNNKFRSHLTSCCIVLRITCPYTPSQNGIAKRKHRHVTETGLTIMFHARVLLSLGLRLSRQLFISSTDSPRKLLMAKLPTSSCLVNNLTTLCFAPLDVYAFLICEIMLITNYLSNTCLVSF